MKYFIRVGLLLLILPSLISSCIKKDFDTPPDNRDYDPALTVTHTIKEIIDLSSPTLIAEDWVIAGIVNIDDREGNYYKKITIQDETGGIEILLDQNNLYNDYPVGRKIYVRLKGLYKSDYNGLPQLGYTPDGTGSLSDIPFSLIERHIVKANYPNTLTPVTVTLADLASPSASAHLINKLVYIEDVEFVSDVIGLPIADPASVRSATNRNIQECSSSTKVVVRTSGYAKFQPQPIPGGNGSITAIYTVFGSTPQLVIRSMDDIQMTGTRCDGSSPTAEVIMFDEFNNLSQWTPVSVKGDQVWSISTAYGNPKPCVMMSGYVAPNNYENEDWLITKPIDLSGFTSVTCTFESAENYSGTALQFFISTDYSGTGDPNDATWTPISFNRDEVSGFVWTHSGDIDLSAYVNQTIYLAFKVTSTTSASKTWEIDNFRIMGER